jgi:hypothetical protein
MGCGRIYALKVQKPVLRSGRETVLGVRTQGDGRSGYYFSWSERCDWAGVFVTAGDRAGLPASNSSVNFGHELDFDFAKNHFGFWDGIGFGRRRAQCRLECVFGRRSLQRKWPRARIRRDGSELLNVGVPRPRWTVFYGRLASGA